MLKILASLNPTKGKALFKLPEQIKRISSSPLVYLSSVPNRKISIQPSGNHIALPPLPVPPLEVTLEKYLKSVKPLLSEEEFAITQDVTKKFSCSGGIGQKLQKLLEARAETHDNWLADWWLNTAYLEFRWPVVVHSSPGLVFPLQSYNTQNEQITLAARVILAALDFRKIIDENKLPLERMGKDPLDMSQYSKILGTCRIPELPRDSLSFANPSNPPVHVAVAYKNHFYEVPVYSDNFQPLSEEQIVSQLQEIVKMNQQPGIPVGILTSENRDVWAKAYEELTKDSRNRKSLKSIKKSLFLVCLDGPNPDMGAPNRQTIAAYEMVHGCGSKSNGANRWFDKTVQFVIGANGELGLTYEHSPAEGPPIASLMDHVMMWVDKGGLKHAAAPEVPVPKYLPFNVSSDLQDVIKNAERNLDCLVDDLEMYGFTYKKYGKEFPKSQKLSPDSFIQMAIQFAFYRLHKVPGAHYESASTRKYVHGRTETIRSCSIESVAFARAMLDPTTSNQAKVQALQEAVGGHKKYTLEAVNGFGVDRHLLGLKLVALRNGIEVPKFFQDLGYTRSSHMRISTSQVAGKCDSFMCYGPLVADGYACCYNPRPHEIVMGLSAFTSCSETSVQKFHDALVESFDDMYNVLTKTQRSKL